ncbi:hypothetical protein F8388_005325 [Cannabis sativa]|uniref:Uncharacterized protein n=1 Tax=Cannabis sativa TaxID=3483 RepID=A0A7J6FYW3_CANSA|nr:hypothetical protein F8388_005325 [Cannabis sativa]KAF4374909.1 hypothetical protein G4B88_004660 [Cannabis sativa]
MEMDGDGDMDSLFEGMVLFNPISEHPSHSPSHSHSDSHSQSESESHSLFTDLTILSPSPSESPSPSLSESKSFNQIQIQNNNNSNHKKKKRPALRIGYARNASAVAFDDNPPISDDHQHLPSSNEPPCSSVDVDFDFRLLQIKNQISEKLEFVRQLAASVSADRKEAIANRRKAAQTLHRASNAYAELETRLDEACRSEDFETAETLSESLAAAESEKQTLVAALADAEARCDEVELRMKEDTSEKAELGINTAEQVSSKKLEEWQCSTESLELKKMELEIESNIVNEARTMLTSSIENSVEDDQREKESLCKKKSVLLDELQELLALVKQKEQEIAETDSNIKAVENRIAHVVSGFQEMHSNIDSKFGNLQSCISDIELESKSLCELKKEIDDFVVNEQEKERKLRELANSSKEEAEAYHQVVELRKNLMTFVLKSKEDKDRLAKTEKKLSDEVQMLHQEVSSSRLSLQELSTRKSSIQQDIASSKQKIIFIDKRVPELEVEKKVAATARNFREAARIAAEAKSLTVEKNGIETEMKRGLLELEKLEKEINDTVEKLGETEVAISSKEKELAMARFERLVLTAGYAEAERAVALEFGDAEEAKLLLAEKEVAESEAKDLEPIYNFKVEELPNIPKHFISMELIANLGKKQLEELAASIGISPKE